MRQTILRNALVALFTVVSMGLLNSQVFSENFDGGVPGSMTQTTINGNISWGGCGGDTGGAPCPVTGSGSATFFVGNYTAFSTALNTPELDLSSGVYKLSFNHVARSWGADMNELHVDISTNGGSTWTTMQSYLDETFDVTNRTIFLSEYTPSSNTKIRFRAVNHYGYRLIIDDILISEVTTDDIKMNSLDVDAILPQGVVEIKGSLINAGFSTLSSFDLNWQVDGGAVNTQNYSGQSIQPGQEFNFNHSTSWNAVPGAYSLKVWISNTNVNDSNSANDELTKSISIASNSVYKTPIYEKFTSSTCAPCAEFNENTFNAHYANNMDKVILINYQMNWPGNGDPYFTQEGATRRAYYNVSAVPQLFLNSNSVPITIVSPATDAVTLNNLLNEAILQQAYFKIDADHTLTGNNIDVEINITPYLTGNFTVHAMVTEKITTENATTNGETSFKHVFMKALPNASGTAVSFTHDQPYTLNLSADLSSTFIEEMDDLAVVIFIQDNATKEIMQSVYTLSSDMVMGVDDATAKSEIILVPNPTSGIVKVISKDEVQLQVFDLSGRNVFNQSKVAANSTLDLSRLGKGIFLVNMIQKDGTKIVKKLVIK